MHGEGPPQRTRRWFADTSAAYALAAILLVEHARGRRAEFAFGPLDAQAMLAGGLEVSGPSEVLERVAELLAGVPGLAEQPD